MASDAHGPHYSDPALTDPGWPGLHAHRHAPDRLHGWVFLQHQVWVDYYGNEHEIEYMDRDYVANVIAFSRERALRIRLLVAVETLHQQTRAASEDDYDQALSQTLAEVGADDALHWLEQTPLLRALRRRLISTESA